MDQLARLSVDEYGDPRGITYGQSLTANTWDYLSIQGCHCDQVRNRLRT